MMTPLYTVGSTGTWTAYPDDSCLYKTSNAATTTQAYTYPNTWGYWCNKAGNGTAITQPSMNWLDSTAIPQTYKLIGTVQQAVAAWQVLQDGVSKWNIAFDIIGPSRQDRMREIIRSRVAPAVLRKSLQTPADEREQRARQTPRLVVGDSEYRRFHRRGFVLVRGKSGNVYQIFPAHGLTTVWKHHVAIERLCVVLNGDFPPTDSLIMRALLIMNDEADFRRRANVSKVAHQTERPALVLPTVRPLVDIHRELKIGVAL